MSRHAWSVMTRLVLDAARALAPSAVRAAGYPTVIHPTTADWAIQQGAGPAFAPPRPYFREIAHLTSAPVQPKPEAFHLPDDEIGDFDRMLGAAETRTPFVAGLPGASVQGRNGYVLDRNGGVLKDAPKVLRSGFKADDEHPLRYKRTGARAVKLGGLSATIAVFSVNNYYHWLYDALPRLQLLREAGFDLSTIENFIVTEDSYGFVRSTMRMLGLAEDRLKIASDEEVFQCEYLLVPSMPAYADRSVPDWIAKFLRSSFLPRAAKMLTPPKIFIGRKSSGGRVWQNEEEALGLLTSRGFVRIYPEDYDFAEQVALFHHATDIVALHGAGLTNLFFCRPGTRVLEIFSADYVHPCYWPVAARLALRYAYLIGSGGRRDRNYGAAEVKTPIMVDPRRLARILTEFFHD